jgi:DNA-binding SARP family transcriptional activator/predicted ATPase
MECELHLTLLGNPEVRRDGDLIDGFRSGKAQALLYYLAATGRPHARPALSGLLWGEAPEDKARRNLRQTLSNLRHLVGPHLDITRQAVAFNRHSPYRLDVECFESLATGASPDEHVERLCEAVDLYRGDFLEGFYVRQAPAFEEWALAQRARLRELALSALHSLAVYYTQEGRAGHSAALDYTTRLLALEPWREEAHRGLMLLLALGGQRSAALAQYKTCRQALAEELGVEPGPETTAIYERIRDGELSELRPVEVGVQSLPSPEPHLPAFLDGGAEPTEEKGVVFVGRKRELAKLEGLLERALAGGVGVAYVVGEAGQGKTSLLDVFARQAREAWPELIVASGTCDVYAGLGDPYLPFRDVLAMLTGDVESRWASGAITRDHALRLWELIPYSVHALVAHGPDLIDSLVPGEALERRALSYTLDSATDWLDELKALRASRASGGGRGPDQSHLFEAYAAVLDALAGQGPLLLILDDLHWADLSSISLLSFLGRRLAASPVLIVGAYRLEDVTQAYPSTGSGQAGQHPLQAVLSEFKRRFGDIWVDLDQAGGVEGRGFVDAFLDTEPNRLGEAFRQLLTRATGGHPLFTVELLRDMQERGDVRQDETGRWVAGPSLDWDAVPARVEGVIETRIGRLDLDLRDALTVASVEGEVFTAEVVARVQGLDEAATRRFFGDELDRCHRLVQELGIERAASCRLSKYRFRHNLFRTYLYRGLGEVERAYQHEAVGSALEALYDGQSAEVAVQLAGHFTVAENPARAVPYHRQAGERAMQLAAYQEAITHFNQGLAVLKTLLDNPERARQELTLQIALGNAMTATQGFAASEVGEVYSRARVLSQHLDVGETPEDLPALFGLWVYYATRAEHQTARELGEQLLRLAQRIEDTDLLLEAHHALWTSLYNIGEFSSVRTHCEGAMAMYEPQQHFPLAFCYGGHDAGVCCGNFAGPTMWFLGYPDQALQRNRASIALAQDLSHPFSLALARHWLSVVHQLRREVGPACDSAEAAVTLATERGFPLVEGWAFCIWGWALAQSGQVDEGIARIRQGLAVYRNTGAGMDQTHLLALLAEAHGIAGQTEAGLDVIAEALEAVHQTGERHYLAELHRLKGELLRPNGAQGAKSEADSDAEACFEQAVQFARQQKAKSLELRAVMSLSRLWHAQGAPDKREEACRMLSEVCDWFTEGFNTPDLKEAEALLAELSVESVTAL